MRSLEELRNIKTQMQSKIGIRSDSEADTRIVVGMATCGIAAGARPVLAALTEEVAKRALKNTVISQTGCIGICQYEPVIEVFKAGQEKVTYVNMTPEKIVRIVNDHIVNDNVVTEYTIGANAK